MTETLSTVGADLLPIPDGVDGDVVRIGIQVTPSRLSPGAIELAGFPSWIAGHRHVRIRVAALDGKLVSEVGSATTESKLADFLDGPHPGGGGTTRKQAATELWRRIFEPIGFESLFEALPAPAAAGAARASAARPLPVGSTRTSDIQLFFDSWFAAQGRSPGMAAFATAPTDVRALSGRIARWMTTGPDVPAAFRAPAAPIDGDPFARRAEELTRLKRGFEILLADRGPASLAAAESADLEAVVGSIFREHSVMLFGERAEPDPPGDIEDEDWGTDTVEAARRKLGGLLSLPTLSHYFGLAVQVEIPRAALAGLERGAIAAEFVDAAGSPVANGEPAWTAFEYAPEAGYFGPASEAGDSAPDAELFSKGFLNLGAVIGSGAARQPRFALGTDDVVSMLQDLVAAAGRAPASDQAPFAKPDKRRRGVVLYDRAAKQAQADDNRRAEEEDQWAGGARVNFAEDLVRGVRPDFAVVPADSGSLAIGAERWRPVTARTVRCADPLLDPAFYEHETIRGIADRDHGFAIAIEELKDMGGGGEPTSVRQDEMFACAGESLAVSRGARDGVEVSREYDVGLDLSYDLPGPGEAPELGMPPLREGVGYVCGCRLVYANGAGPGFRSARERYAADPGILIGDADGKPLRYPPEIVSPPEIHLKWDDRLVRARDPEAEAPGENSHLLVIRDGRGEASRFITPPRLSFDAAELQGQFDWSDVSNDVPPGALEGAKGLWLFGPGGVFPEARFGDRHGPIRWLDGELLRHVPVEGAPEQPILLESPEYKNIPSRQSRGTVAILGRRKGDAQKGAPFYADRGGRRIDALLSRTGLESPKWQGDRAERSFWSPKERPTDAAPILLQLRDGGGDKAAFDPDRDVTITDVDGVATALPLLRVRLPKAEICELELRGFAPAGKAKAASVTLVHAVERPLTAPSFEPAVAPPPLCATPDLGLNAVTVSVGTEIAGIAAAGLQSWREQVREFESTGVDMRCWPSDEGGSTTFFAGRVAIDRKSTGVLRCEAEWQEFDEATVSLGANGEWVRNPAIETAQLFRIDVERHDAEGPLDLLRTTPAATPQDKDEEKDREVTGKPGKLRGLSHAFRDGRARELKVKMVATSAFTGFYPEAGEKPGGRDWIGKYERASSKFDDAPSVWTECTFRPPPPAIDRIMPLFRWDKIEGKRESTRRSAKLRIYLDEGWFASGADERLGIVLLDGDDPKTVCAYEEGKIGAYHRFVTRAGADPVRSSTAVPIRLEPRHFPNAPAPAEEALLFLGDAGAEPTGSSAAADGAAPPLAVKVVHFRPEFSKKDGLYCDVEVDLGASCMPFLQLGLVRFQPHAVSHLRLSHALEYQVQLVPERRLWVEDRPGHGKRVVVIEGPGFTVPAVHPPQPAHRSPVVDLQVLSWDADAKEWRHAATVGTGLDPACDPATQSYRWEREFDLPVDGSGIQQFVLVAEEYERLPLDEPTGRYIEGKAEFAEVEGRRLTFSCLQRMRYPQ